MLQAQPSLDDYLNFAYANNPLLKSGQNAVKSASIDSAMARSQFGPQIGFQGDASYYPTNGKFGYDVALSNKGILGSVVNFDQAIPFQNQMKPQLKAASLNRQKATNALHLTRKEIKRNVTRQYLVTYGDQLQYSYNSELLNTLQNESSVLLELTRANVYQQTDYLAFLTNVRKQALLLTQARIQLLNDLSQLRNLCGIIDSGLVALPSPQMIPEGSDSTTPTAFLKQYQIDSLRLVNQTEINKQQYQPKLRLHADAGYMASFEKTPGTNFGGGAGLSLSIPIYDGHQKELQQQQLMLQQEDLDAQYSYFKQQYNQQINELFRQLGQMESQQTEVDDQLRMVNQLIRANRKLVTQGTVSIPQYFMVIQNFIDLKNEQGLIRIKRWLIINEINYWTE
ncbi:hypothetical protein SD074_11530 [Prolixibacter sp. SD074]|nr:hypothetical protein SD074_11530 [Prolixibacter sp. SD074]